MLFIINFIISRWLQQVWNQLAIGGVILTENCEVLGGSFQVLVWANSHTNEMCGCVLFVFNMGVEAAVLFAG